MSFRVRLEKLAFKRGDVLLLKGSPEACRHALKMIQALPNDFKHELVERVGNIPVIPLDEAELELADEKRMNDSGWFRSSVDLRTLRAGETKTPEP